MAEAMGWAVRLRISKRRMARMFDWSLVALGAVTAYLVTAVPAMAPLLGKWGPVVTVGIGVLNVLLNRLPKLPADTDA